MDGIKTVFGRNVQKYRMLKNWSQAELAEKIDISPTFMLHIEHGTRGVSMETIELLARSFGIPFAALFEEEKEAVDSTTTMMKLESKLKSELQRTVERCIEDVYTAG